MPRDFLSDDNYENPEQEKLPGRDFLAESEPRQESLGEAALWALPRVGQDLYKGAVGFAKNIPGYARAATTEVPGAFQTLKEHPAHAGQQALAGMAELGQNVFNAPHDIANYLSNRLNLLPKDINQKIQMARMPDSTNEINATFGTPQYAGENLIRGIPRNALNILGGGKALSTLNPMNLTAKRIAKDVVKTEKKQINLHSKEYNKIWDEASKTGFNNVPVDLTRLDNNLSVIKKYKVPREYQSLDNMIKNPTLENAQKAQSDMKQISRGLADKSRTSSLTSEELAVHEAAEDAIRHINENMFKDSAGNINPGLQKKYQKVTNSYLHNVVPYRYNADIQAFKNKEMLADELVNKLSRGEFAAKKGRAHPAITVRNNLKPTLTAAGLLGGGAALYNNLMGPTPGGQQSQ